MAETLLRTAFAPRNLPAGAECIDVYGYAAPLAVVDPVADYRAVRERVGILDFSMLLKVDVRGAGAVEAVNGGVVRDLSGVAPGRIAYGPVVNDAGGMLDDSTCFVYGPDHVRVIGGPGMPAAIEAATAGRGLDVEHLRERQCHLTLQGPRSRDVLERLVDVDVSAEAFPYYTFRDGVTASGIPALVSRMGFTAELGYEIYAPVERALELWDAVVAAGAAFGIQGVGAAAIMMLRIEAGMVMGEGLEYDESVTPWECNLGWAVPASKAIPYRGRDAVLAARETAPFRTVSIRLSGGDDRATGAPLYDGEAVVGHVTMSVPSPHLGFETLGLARVEKAYAGIGSRLVARLDDGDVAGEVVATPVYDPDRHRVRS
ncbi:MAG: aminomethyltransferase [Gaiellaceae bacterium]|nr:aminomethyltransferase [Gaiellaceae bacterium]